jgi:hypothetical protein
MGKSGPGCPARTLPQPNASATEKPIHRSLDKSSLPVLAPAQRLRSLAGISESAPRNPQGMGLHIDLASPDFVDRNASHLSSGNDTGRACQRTKPILELSRTRG